VYSERLAKSSVYLTGRNGGAVPRLPNNPDRVFSTSQSEDDVAAAIANLFATPPPRVDELFVDTDVRTKIGVFIASNE
jgi:hypothetical protein